MRRARYRTTAELAAVHLRDKDHDKPGIIATIPADVIIQIDGESELVSKMVNVLWGVDVYTVFRADLERKAVLLHESESQAKAKQFRTSS
jgi:hypothetical protein